MAGLPWVVLLMVWDGYRQMDEYGKLNMLRASSMALVALMLTVMTYFPLEQALKLPVLPMWILWPLGWLVWGIAFGLLNRSRRE